MTKTTKAKFSLETKEHSIVLRADSDDLDDLIKTFIRFLRYIPHHDPNIYHALSDHLEEVKFNYLKDA